MMSYRMVSIAMGLCLIGGCDAGERSGFLARADTNLNGRALNGTHLGASGLYGTEPASILVAVSLGGVTQGGAALHSVALAGTVFHGSRAGAPVGGTDFLGAEFHGTAGDGRSYRLRLDGITPGAAASADVWSYQVSFRGEDGGWYPLCRSESGAAIPVGGRWDYRQGVLGGGSKVDDPGSFTFACRGISAIAKCIDYGYRPWASASGVPLAAHHQACTRLVRGDYCGDGTAYTSEGEWIDVYDALGIQVDMDDWVIEAEWDTEGARCLSPYNRAHGGVPCYTSRLDAQCGAKEHFQSGTLLMDEVPVNLLP